MISDYRETFGSVKTIQQQSAESDRMLVERCLADDPVGWSELYRSGNPAISAVIRQFLDQANEELVEELAARFWHFLVQDQCRLLAGFRADRGVRLITFLSSIARNVARGYLRSEQRRRKYETAPAVQLACLEGRAPLLAKCEFEEFLQSLTHHERRFARWCIEGCGDPGARGRRDYFSSTVNSDYQLRFRLRNKLHDYLS